jgi:hypothetical protein
VRPTPPVHGRRATYQAGCGCQPCRAANAAYEAAYRRDQRLGKVRLGAVVSATEARKRVQQLRAEHVNVAAALGLKHRDVRLHPAGITVRKLLKIRRLYRLLMLEAPDLPRPSSESRQVRGTKRPCGQAVGGIADEPASTSDPSRPGRGSFSASRGNHP